MYDLLPLLWFRSGATMLLFTICCRCFGFEAVRQFEDVRFVAVALASKRCPNSKMYDLFLSLWPRSGAPMLGCAICCRCFGLPMLRCAICCRCFGLEVVPGAKLYDLLPLLWSRSNANDLLLLLWSRSDAPMRRYTICCLCSGLEVVPPNAKMYDLRPLLWSPRCPNAEMYDLLPLLWFRSGALMLRCTICCHCFGFEVVPQCYYLRFVAVALVSKRCPNSKMYDLLPLLWPRSIFSMLRCTICCCCFDFEVVAEF